MNSAESNKASTETSNTLELSPEAKLIGKLKAELKTEKLKCQKIWDELLVVGRSWEAQAQYISGLEAERQRLSAQLIESQAFRCKVVEDFLMTFESAEAELSSAPSERGSQAPNRVDVLMGWLFFLNRPPDPEGVEYLLKKALSREHLLQLFLGSEEVRKKYPTALPYRSSGNESPMVIEEVKSQKEMDQLFANTGRVWTQLGESEPHWSVLTREEFRSGSISKTMEAFYQSGNRTINTFLSTLERNHVKLSELSSCLDFGCGVGRLSAALAPYFESIIGVDISHAHLKIAKEALEKRGITNVSWFHLCSVFDMEKLPMVDAVVSIIVLQHNPPPIAAHLLRQLFKKLNPLGIAFFQILTYIENYSFCVKNYLESMKDNNRMEMHPLPLSQIFKICEESSVEVLELFTDDWGGSLKGISQTFLVRKR